MQAQRLAGILAAEIMQGDEQNPINGEGANFAPHEHSRAYICVPFQGTIERVSGAREPSLSYCFSMFKPDSSQSR